MQLGIRQYIFLAVLLAVPLVSYFIVFKPQNIEIARAKTEIDVKRATLDKLRAQTAKTADLEKANAEMLEAIAAIEAKLPSTKEVDNVLREVAQIAARSRLEMPVFKKVDKVLPAGRAQEQPLEVELTGEFDGFYKFLLELEKVPRITRLPDMKLTRVETKDGDGHLKATFTLSIYYQGTSVATAEGK
ncbi:MAG: type 4a pilus biogenesis protein PilO [Phycisphaerales bacterium]